MKKGRKIIIFIFGVFIIVISILVLFFIRSKNSTKEISLNLTDLTYGYNYKIKNYEQSDFDQFIRDYQKGKLPDVYITEFLFDGVSMYKPYDLDDFIASGNDCDIDNFDITVVNINMTGDITISGKLIGGMVTVNTNSINGDVNLLLNNVSIDTDSKKVPAIYVYNKDITYNKHKVTIKTLDGTKNYIDGGKLKKVSLIGGDVLSNYSNNYSGEMLSMYQEYTKYYGIYTSSEVNDILFAKVQADREDLADGDPYYYYKASGAISSDIDLYFEGTGYLEVISKNKEGIESKGNISLLGGTGDYVIEALDDCLNTTTNSSEFSGAHNTLLVDVNSLTAIVSSDASEGDAIDSNGTITINGGTIIAIAHSGQDAGFDSNDGTYINGGTIIASGDMYDEISSGSNQAFIGLSFSENIDDKTLITLLDSNESVVFAFINDRSFTNLIYSSSKLVDGSYYLYKNGTIVDGVSTTGFYKSASGYIKGKQLGYKANGIGADNRINSIPKDMRKPDMGGMPNDVGNVRNDNFDRNDMMLERNTDTNSSASYKEFNISGIQNLFSGISDLAE